jgi:N-acetylneuraminate synthase
MFLVGIIAVVDDVEQVLDLLCELHFLLLRVSALTPFELMHCFSTYPMKVEHANLITMKHLEKEYNCKVGYSGHEKGIAVSYLAAAMGATSIERHITIDRSSYGSDQAASLEERGMRELVSVIKIMQMAKGTNMLGQILPEEIEISKKLRAHIKKNFLIE